MNDILCKVYKSKSEFIGCLGRFNSARVEDSGLVRIVDYQNGGDWIDLKIDTNNVAKVRELATKGEGSLLVIIGGNGVGHIINSIDDMNMY